VILLAKQDHRIQQDGRGQMEHLVRLSVALELAYGHQGNLIILIMKTVLK
jgi:hypothetical protein